MPLSLPDHDLSDERREFRDVVRRFFAEHAPIGEVRRAMEAGAPFDGETWKRASEDLGLAGIAIDETHGGQGFGLLELGIALAEAGRCLAPVPLLASSALAARAVAAVTNDAGRWLEPLAVGAPACLAWVATPHDWSVGTTALRASDQGEACRLEGEARYVVDARPAERVFAIARNADSGALGLYAVEATADGLVREAREGIDPTREITTVRFDGAAAQCVATGAAVEEALASALDEATALLCAEMVGGMQRVLESAVDYANERYQFSRPIGSFQAIKHKCADMLVAFEGARTATHAALLAADEKSPEARELASVAKAQCSRAYLQIALENMQIHGGVGYTWEYDAHLYYRRAKASEALLGDAAWHHERLAQGLVEGAA